MKPKLRPILLHCCISAGVLAAPLQAAISYATPESLYTQNFDSLASSGTPAWANDSTITGFYWWNSTVAGTPATYVATATTSATQNQILSLGKVAATPSYVGTVGDRALGAQGNTANTSTYGMQILNTSGFTLQSFTLGYTGEQWRTIQNEAADKLVLEYAIFAPNSTNRLATASTVGWTAVSALQFNAPTQITTASTGIDGNAAANRTALSGGVVSGLAWADGQELWIRWRDTGTPQSAMGIDDLSFSASTIPEPSAALLGVFGALALLRRRR